jgi:two-component system, sensor histidine kinase and response regulator
MEITDNLPYKILVVDDNPDNIQVIGNMLREAGYLIGFAIDGQQALNQLHKATDYDLVLLDVDMPVMNGYDACRAMRADEILHEIPVIFLTAFADVENKIIGFEAGAQDYVTKPYHVQELLSRVRTHVELKRNREKLRKVNSWLEEQVHLKTIELEKALFELHRLDKLKTNFLFQISEEIKTPLNGIIGTINLVKNEDRSPAVKDMIEILEISLSRIESFVSKAAFSTQLSSKKYVMKITNINLNELIKYAIIDLNNLFQTKNLEINISTLTEPINIEADKDLIFKALTYLLDNAAKFSQKNDEIAISIASEKNQVILSVIDHGPGFSEQELNKLLLPFDPDSEFSESNTGISLHIVKQIMDLHKGKLRLQNSSVGGACVQLIFNSLLQ